MNGTTYHKLQISVPYPLISKTDRLKLDARKRAFGKKSFSFVNLNNLIFDLQFQGQKKQLKLQKMKWLVLQDVFLPK